MKPRLFIGSSTESLEIAEGIKKLLDYDAAVTVWTQDIFNLNNSILYDLEEALENFDFAVFVFAPEDVLVIRDIQKKAVRDNILFEMGLFIGRLGRDKVCFVRPKISADFHIPSDLLGITYGTYDNGREDGNLALALVPFCEEVKGKLKAFVLENLTDFSNETKLAKKLAVQKPDYWEFLLVAELLKSRMRRVNADVDELKKDLVYVKGAKMDAAELLGWISSASGNIVSIIAILKKAFEVELPRAIGAPGHPGNLEEIKRISDKFAAMCQSLLSWEHELISISTDDEDLREIIALMRGWSFDPIEQINSLQRQMENVPKAVLAGPAKINIDIVFSEPPNVKKIFAFIDKVKRRFW